MNRADYFTNDPVDAGRWARAFADPDDRPDPSDAAPFDATTEAAMERCAQTLGYCPECGEQRGRCLECFDDHCLTLLCMPRDCRDDEMRSVMGDDERKTWG